MNDYRPAGPLLWCERIVVGFLSAITGVAIVGFVFVIVGPSSGCSRNDPGPRPEISFEEGDFVVSNLSDAKMQIIQVYKGGSCADHPPLYKVRVATEIGGFEEHTFKEWELKPYVGGAIELSEEPAGN